MKLIKRALMYVVSLIVFAAIAIVLLVGMVELIGCGHGDGFDLFDDQPVIEDDGSSDDCNDEQTIVDEPEPTKPVPIPMEEGK